MDKSHNSDHHSSSSPNDTESHDPPESHSSTQPLNSLFLRLSPELRNQIYHHIFACTVIKVALDIPGLPLTCKQIYTECIELIYASTAFYVQDWQTLIRWLKQLPQRRRNLITELWCDPDLALPDETRTNVTCHGVLRRMTQRLKGLGLGLGGQDVLRSKVMIDARFNIWSSDPALASLVVGEAYCDWSVSLICTS